LEDGKVTLIGNIDPLALEKVVVTFNAALKYFPDNPHLLEALGMTLATAGRPDQAVPLFRITADLAPQNVNAWLNLARAALADNELEISHAALMKVFALDANNHFALALLFECQWRKVDFPAALETARRWNDVAPDANSRAALAKAENEQPAPTLPPRPRHE
ncbi:MAG TPA: tetratricopeptide repeat protein, partial [Verrucomicrobiae bacterium]